MFKEAGLFKKSTHLESNFELQITALVDTLVIILIFLLKSMATDSLDMDQGKTLKIPSITGGISTGEGNRLMISTEGIHWNNQKYVPLEHFSKAKTSTAEWKQFSSAIASSVKEEKEKNEFKGVLFLQADKEAPYSLVQEALGYAKTQGYKDIRFVGAKYN